MSPSPFAPSLSAAAEPPAAEAVLLVEDDDIVAGLVERILARRFQRVLRAVTGAEGEKLFVENRAAIGLVMIDCWLPDVEGTILCRRLRRDAPGLPVLLTSGCDNPEARRLADDGITAFLPKPFYPAQIEREVGALLSSAAA